MAIALAVTALAVPANASAAAFFLFDRASAAPNERVTVRTGGTPQDFTLRRRVKPFQRPVRLYLVRKDAAAKVRSRFDPRLNFVGSLVADRNGRGLLKFSVPPLDAASYTIAFWCPGCAAYSRGRTFFVQQPDQFAQQYRSQALLRIAAIQSCPVTIPNGSRPPGQPPGSWHGNGLLWGLLRPDGVDSIPPDRVATDGSIFDKLIWATSSASRAPKVSGERLDARSPPLRVLTVRKGSFSGATKPSWATAVVVPAAGCWRLSAHVGDVSLTYVVDVVVRAG